ncbi:MAG: adenylyl-sulfate kinase [Desulfobacteraceae bacterium]|nr:adenylyl-sulfate kinase [Desulfobacteraceae bacterium]
MSKGKASKGFVVWLTGLSGSGKSTLAQALCEKLEAAGLPIERLDGDVMRGVFPNTGFTKAARDEHIRRVGFMASRLEHHGVIVVASFISPYREARDFVRGLCKNFVEVYVKTSIEECRRRDVKGLYKKAADGQISGFTGLDDPYEEPLTPEVVIETEKLTLEKSVDKMLQYLKEHRRID